MSSLKWVELKSALFWLCLYKLVYWTVLLAALKLGGDFGHFGNLWWPRETSPTFASHFIPYDGSFYLDLSETGYQAGTRSCAFYPLWPAVIKTISCLINADPLITGLVLSNIFSTAGWLMFYQIVSKRWGGASAAWALIFMLAFPGSLFYQFLYSESLFLFLVMVLWLALDRECYSLALGAAFLLPLTRAIGVFCFLPIFYHFLNLSPPCWLRQWPRLALILINPNRSPKLQSIVEQCRDEFNERNGLVRGWWLILAPFLGWLFYLLIMFVWTGNPFEGFSAQKYWGVHSVDNLWNFPKFISNWFAPTSFNGFRGSLLNACSFTCRG